MQQLQKKHTPTLAFSGQLLIISMLKRGPSPERCWNAEPWWRHQMETFSVLLAGNSQVTGEFRAQRPVTRSFDVFFDVRLNIRLSKQWCGWWVDTPSHPLWRHCNEGPARCNLGISIGTLTFLQGHVVAGSFKLWILQGFTLVLEAVVHCVGNQSVTQHTGYIMQNMFLC